MSFLFFLFLKSTFSHLFWEGEGVEVRGRMCELSLLTVWVLGINLRSFNNVHPFFLSHLSGLVILPLQG